MPSSSIAEEQLRSHLLGQRHFYNQRQREVAQRSVFVSGFRGSSVEKEELNHLFQQFGPVHKVIAVKDERPRVSVAVQVRRMYRVCLM